MNGLVLLSALFFFAAVDGFGGRGEPFGLFAGILNCRGGEIVCALEMIKRGFGVVEGLESADGLVLAVQCHPEELTAHAWARDLFRCFVATAAGRRAVGAGAGR